MWVMLLWALTLPGQEVEVYRFLMKGPVATSVADTAQMHKSTSSVKAEGVQAFLDANTSSSLHLAPQQVINCLLQVFTFAPPSDDSLSTYAANYAWVVQLAQIFPISILPNAP